MIKNSRVNYTRSVERAQTEMYIPLLKARSSRSSMLTPVGEKVQDLRFVSIGRGYPVCFLEFL
jgi:hypothetical protein